LRYVERKAKVIGNVTLGKGVFVAADAEVVSEGNETIVVGDYSFILRGALLLPSGGKIIIGRNVGINPYTVIYGHGGVEIGNDVLIATSCVIISANHNFSRLDIPINSQGLTCRGIRIEDDVWLGARVTVLDGVKIGRGAVIGAGAVVTHDIPPEAIAVGVPARVIGTRAEKNGSQQHP